MFQSVFRSLIIAGLMSTVAASSAADVKTGKPLRALLVTGGCCHNYALQSAALTNAMAKFARVHWTVVNECGNGTKAMIPLYDKPDWAEGYDVVVHNECFADTADH